MEARFSELEKFSGPTEFRDSSDVSLLLLWLLW